MTKTERRTGGRRMSAADWVARLSGEPAEAEWLAFDAWLQSAPGHRAAYDEALALWLALDRQAAPLAAAISDHAIDSPDRLAGRPRTALYWGGATGLVAAAAVTFAALHPYRAAAPTIYATDHGQRRAITLADGTRVVLNSASKIFVRLERNRREITLAEGEATFEVTHDPSRPFQVHVGDQILRDIGTEFDVLRSKGEITVTVRQGLVEVRRAKGGQRSLALAAGSRLTHREGADSSTVMPVSADDAFSWRSGRLIYRDRPLSEIAADLNRYGENQIRVDGSAAGLRFSGVLIIDDQSVMVRRLAALLPISQTRQDAVITLRGVDSTR